MSNRVMENQREQRVKEVSFWLIIVGLIACGVASLALGCGQ